MESLRSHNPIRIHAFTFLLYFNNVNVWSFTSTTPTQSLRTQPYVASKECHGRTEVVQTATDHCSLVCRCFQTLPSHKLIFTATQCKLLNPQQSKHDSKYSYMSLRMVRLSLTYKTYVLAQPWPYKARSSLHHKYPAIF
jgi:hypothetical protein